MLYQFFCISNHQINENCYLDVILGQQCSGKEFTFSFVIDGSSSISVASWELVKDFTARLVNRFVNLNGPTISLYQFSDETKLEVQCGEFFGNTTVLLKHIRDLIQIDGGTRIGDAVEKAANYTLNTITCHQNRTNLNKVMFVLTDGQDSSSESNSLYTQVKNDGFTIYAIGVGSGVDESELLNLASDSRKRFLVQQFDDLNETEVVIVYSEFLQTHCGKFTIGCEYFSEGTVERCSGILLNLSFYFRGNVPFYHGILLGWIFANLSNYL